MSFKKLGIQEDILSAIESIGFENPTPIQEQAIPVLLQGGSDFIGLAQTGTGKTAAFGIPLLHQVDADKKYPQALVLCPTRELCLQITKELQSYSKNLKTKVVPVYGGVSITTQITAIKRGAQIVVGTPGRLIDHLKRKTLDLKKVAIVALDEADEMFKMGFQEDIKTILSQTPKEKNVWLFSATMPAEIKKITKKYMHDPVQVTIGTQNASASNIEHTYCVVNRRDAYSALRRFIDHDPDFFGIVFCRTKRDARDINAMLSQDGYRCDALHGDLSQAQRDAVMNKFRKKQIQVLIATDIAARGIDVTDVTHVIHHKLPDDAQSYTHRSGRTARAGKSGMSIAIVGPREVGRLKFFERSIGKDIKLIQVPSGKEIAERMISQLAKKVQEFKPESQLKDFSAELIERLKDVPKEQIIQYLALLEGTRLIKSKSRSNINADATSRESRYGKKDNENRVFINLGTIDGLDKKTLAKFIASNAGVPAKNLAQFSIRDRFTFFNVETVALAKKIISALHNSTYNGRKLRVELSGSSSGAKRPMRPRRNFKPRR